MIDSVASNTVLLNIALIPSDEISAEVQILSRELSSQGALFEVDGQSRFAHLTVYMARFDSDRVDEVRRRLLDCIPDLPAMSMRHTGYFFTEGRYYEVSYDRSAELVNLHEKVIDQIQLVRHSPGHPVIEGYFGSYREKQQVNAQETGYDLARDLYRPHITITRFETIPDPAELSRARKDLSFTAHRVGLFVADDQGAAKRLVQTFDLTA